MTTPVTASLDPKSKHISLGYSPEVPEIASGFNLTISLRQSPDIQATIGISDIYELYSATRSESFDPDEKKLLSHSCDKFARVLAIPIFARLNKTWETVLSDACRDYLPPGRAVDKYRKTTLRAMSKAASANKAYRSPDSYRIYHHTIPAGKTVDGMAVDLYFDLPSAVGLIDSLSAHK